MKTKNLFGILMLIMFTFALSVVIKKMKKVPK